MQIANGARLIAAVPVYAGNDHPREWLIAVERMDIGESTFNRWVVSTIDNLDASYWHNGSYYSSERDVMAAFYLRVPGLSWLDAGHLRGILDGTVRP